MFLLILHVMAVVAFSALTLLFQRSGSFHTPQTSWSYGEGDPSTHSATVF